MCLVSVLMKFRLISKFFDNVIIYINVTLLFQLSSKTCWTELDTSQMSSWLIQLWDTAAPYRSLWCLGCCGVGFCMFKSLDWSCGAPVSSVSPVSPAGLLRALHWRVRWSTPAPKMPSKRSLQVRRRHLSHGTPLCCLVSTVTDVSLSPGIKHEWQVNGLDDIQDRRTLAEKLGGNVVVSLEGKPLWCGSGEPSGVEPTAVPSGPPPHTATPSVPCPEGFSVFRPLFSSRFFFLFFQHGDLINMLVCKHPQPPSPHCCVTSQTADRTLPSPRRLSLSHSQSFAKKVDVKESATCVGRERPPALPPAHGSHSWRFLHDFIYYLNVCFLQFVQADASSSTMHQIIQHFFVETLQLRQKSDVKFCFSVRSCPAAILLAVWSSPYFSLNVTVTPELLECTFILWRSTTGSRFLTPAVRDDPTATTTTISGALKWNIVSEITGSHFAIKACGRSEASASSLLPPITEQLVFCSDPDH